MRFILMLCCDLRANRVAAERKIQKCLLPRDDTCTFYGAINRRNNAAKNFLAIKVKGRDDDSTPARHCAAQRATERHDNCRIKEECRLLSSNTE